MTPIKLFIYTILFILRKKERYTRHVLYCSRLHIAHTCEYNNLSVAVMLYEKLNVEGTVVHTESNTYYSRHKTYQ